jgi:hypothetical protein
MRTCYICYNFEGYDAIRQQTRIGGKYDTLAESAEKGCITCNIVKEGLEKCFPQVKEDGRFIELDMAAWKPGPEPVYKVWGKVRGIEPNPEVEIFRDKGAQE